MTAKSRTVWTFIITSAALFMGSLDNLVVTTALPSIRVHLHASLAGLEWTVNAYTLTFAVLLLTGAALGELYGRRRMFVTGLAVFTASSAAAALAPGISWLVAARAAQGAGAAVLIPLTLTLLSAAVPPARRGLALGAWGAVGGLAVALGPLVGGAVVQGSSWQWIFWLNVPIGVAVLPLAATKLTESRGPASRLDLPGLVLASAGLAGIVLALVRGNTHGWTSITVLPPMAAGAALVVAFAGWELRASQPMLPPRLFRSRTFTAANAASLLMFFGMFGSIFLLAQFLQTVQHYSPLQAGLRTLPWTAMPVLVTPAAGSLSDRIGGRPLLAAGLALQAAGLGWLAELVTPGVAYPALVPAFVVCGAGMSLFFAPLAKVVLGSVRQHEEGVASGANNAFRALGGVFGIAVLGAVFAANGGYASGHAFTSGLSPALWAGAAAVAAAAAAALAIPRAVARPVPEPAAPAQPAREPVTAAAAAPASWAAGLSRPAPGGPQPRARAPQPARTGAGQAESFPRAVRRPGDQTGQGPRAGAGQPRVLLVPGGASTVHGYFPQLSTSLRTKVDVIEVDPPGIGPANDGRPLRLTEYAAAQAQTARSRGNGPLVIAGHSLGGLIALQLALDEPGLVAGLVLLDPTPPTPARR